jgi:outer membrane biosynthesis protein TonB
MKNIKFYWLLLLITFAVSFALPMNAQTKKTRKKSTVAKKKVIRKTVTPKIAVKIGNENSTSGQVFDGPVRYDGPVKDETVNIESLPKGAERMGNIGLSSAKGLTKLPDGSYSTGVVNGKAISMPKPPYPAAAKAVKASGTVAVQVLIDEEGNVVSANATIGHPLLRAVSEQAALGAKFSPTLLEGKKVKVSGIITYNFVAQ